ncbi:MAG: HIT domain-containing protein [Nitrospinota bacterium]
MKHLWAPWRMTYVSGEDSEEGCFFCRKLAEEGRDFENRVLYRSDLAFVIMNAFPYSNGHLMVSPRRHTGDFLGLDGDETAELMSLTQRCVRVLNDALHPHGFNIGLNLGEAAGAGVADHLHLHIVPRWKADTNFMPVLADVKVIPDHLSNTYELLKRSFEKDGR